MRSLQRNWRNIYYAIPQETESILDEYGNDTLEERQVFSAPLALRVNVSANAGQDTVDTFGAQTEYSRTVSYSGKECPLVVGCRVWFGVESPEPHNYTVVKVADSKNGYLIALREVSVRE